MLKGWWQDPRLLQNWSHGLLLFHFSMHRWGITPKSFSQWLCKENIFISFWIDKSYLLTIGSLLRSSNSKTHLDIRRRDFTSSQVWRKLNVDSDAFLTQARCQWSTPWVSKKLTRGGRRRKRILQIRWKKQTVLFFLSLNAETFYECDRNTFPLDEKIHFLNLIFCLFQYQKLLAGNFKKHSCCHLLVFTIFAKFFARFDTNWRRC